jgi:cell division protein FtsZ
MSILIQAPDSVLLQPKIIVFGVGGAGGNAINNMIRSNLQGPTFIAANTDAQALEHSSADFKIQLGATVTRGLGAGASPETGKRAAEESIEAIKAHLENCNLLFITAGMGGGTGTGASPFVAKLAREMGILTIGVVTKPFLFEGNKRMLSAESGLEELKEYVDTLIVIPNQNLFRIANEKTTFADAFQMADDVLYAGVKGVTDLMIMPGLINLDFADIRSIMSSMGKAMMGTGEASGEDRAIKAAEAAITNPLLDYCSMKDAKGVLINITGGKDITLFEVDAAANRIMQEMSRSDANTIFGSTFDEGLNGKIRVSVVATGIDDNSLKSYANNKEIKTGQIEKESPKPPKGNINQIDIFGQYNYTNNVKVTNNFIKNEESNIIDQENHNINKPIEDKIEQQNLEEGESDIYEIPAFLRRKK